MLADAFGAEVLKLRKRPAFWILLAILIAAAVVFGYLLLYVLVVSADDGVPGLDPDAFRASLLPSAVVPTALTHLAGFGAMIALILGALVAGSEYGWSTLKTIAVQRPGRVTLMGGKLLAVGLALAVFVGATMLASWMASLVVAAMEGADTWLPPFVELAQGLAAGWLLLATYAMLGVFVAVLLRGVGLALGLGFIYVFIFEGIMLAVPLPERIAEALRQYFITPNASALARWFGEDVAAMGGQGAGSGPLLAAAVLAGYVALFTALTVLLFRSRPIE